MKRMRVAAAVASTVLAVAAGCTPRQPWSSELVSVKAGGGDSANGPTYDARFALGGEAVAFSTSASDLVAGDTNGVSDVFVRYLDSGTTERITDSPGGQVDDGSTLVDVSDDGGTVLYMTRLRLPAPDKGLERAYFAYDLATGETQVGIPRNPSAYANYGDAALSPDGSMVGWQTPDTDVGPTDTNDKFDVYVHDLDTGDVTLVSANAAGTDAGDRQSYQFSFSPDGTRVAFTSEAGDLVPGDDEPCSEDPIGQYSWSSCADVFVRDLTTGTTTLVTPDATGTGTGNWTSEQPVFSPDGDHVAFTSMASDLGPTDSPREEGREGKRDQYDVYVRDLVAGTTTLVSSNAAGTDSANGRSFSAVYSPDGSRLAFTSVATDLGPDDTDADLTDDAGQDAYVADLATGEVVMASANAAGTDSGNDQSWPLMFSDDGSRLAFTSFATDLGPDGDADGAVYVRDLDTATSTLVGTSADGVHHSVGGYSRWAELSSDGRRAVFTTRGSDFGPTDTNGASDAYLATFAGADLGVTLTAAPEPVAPGGEVTYELTVTNAGPDAADAARVALLVPDAATVTGATGADCALPGGTGGVLSCELGDLDDGSSATVAVTATVGPTVPAGSELTARAQVAADSVDPAGRDDGATVVSTVVSTVGA